jgi:redox-sensitive bicupin YhaK (pirin superfamily)
MRSIKGKYKATYAPMGDLLTYRALPTREVGYIDPFLFLNHHGPQEYGPFNQGLPFGPHPHRGFETLTYILAGDITHRDSGGGNSVIKEGGIQWMTAGRGLIHAEVSSEEFKEKGGEVEVIQIWLNLPARLKMTAPNYIGLQKEEIPELTLDGGKVAVRLISGEFNGTTGPVRSLTDIHMTSLHFKKGGALDFAVAADRNILFYVVNGSLNVNGQTAGTHTLAEFDDDGENIRVEAAEDSVVIFGHGRPYNENIVAHGPFVMNSQTEIMQAMRDYQMGKMGVWTEG